MTIHSDTGYVLGHTGLGGSVYYVPVHQRRAMRSETHPFKYGHYIDGGPWWMVDERSQQYPSAKAVVIQFDGAKDHVYTGSFVMDRPDVPGYQPGFADRMSHVSSDASALANFGSVAFNRLRPAQPSMAGLNALIELKDLPGMIKGAKESLGDLIGTIRSMTGSSQRKSVLSQAAEVNLAVSLGWLPMISDIRNLVKTQRDAQKTLKQLIRDESKPIRRSTKNSKYPISSAEDNWNGFGVSSNPFFLPTMHPGLVTYAYGGGHASGATHSTFKETVWASAQMRYLLPEGPRDIQWKRKMLSRIYGLRVTPEVVYNAIPWSWMVDWFTGLGDFVQAVSPGVEDNLICDYFYIMKSHSWDITSTGSQWVRVGNTDGKATDFRQVDAGYVSYVREKLRIEGSPFGFGLKDSDLSLKQLGILGSLGYSRLPGR